MDSHPDSTNRKRHPTNHPNHTCHPLVYPWQQPVPERERMPGFGVWIAPSHKECSCCNPGTCKQQCEPGQWALFFRGTSICA